MAGTSLSPELRSGWRRQAKQSFAESPAMTIKRYETKCSCSGLYWNAFAECAAST
jgi:hypothetical protein